MEWTKVTQDVLSAPDFLTKPKEVRADFFALLGLCVRAENGGVIVGCQEWNDRAWLLAVGATRAEIDLVVAHKLAAWWREKNLRVFHYDIEGEKRCRRLRRQAKKAANARYAKGNPTLPHGMPHGIPSGIPLAAAQNRTEQKRREEKNKIRDGVGGGPAEPVTPQAAASPVVLSFLVRGDLKKPEWQLTELAIAAYQEAFPGLDVLAEFRKAQLWCSNNAGNRKTRSGMPRFLQSWLERAANRGSPAKAPAQRDIRFGHAPVSDHSKAKPGRHAI